tara:strand:- start:1157 stop:1603 length:447 start_codon:yes stop_codon:yes gene_type:complete
MITGVEFTKITSHTDERGYFREMIRSNDSFVKEGIGQISHSLVHKGVIKAWHAHKYQTQWNYVVNGLISVSLYDLRKDSSSCGEIMTFLCGENQDQLVYKFPPGVAHGYKCIKGNMNIIYVTSGNYDLNDEIRVPYDDKEINFDWDNI